MDVKFQVFISSTFKDLEDERRTVIEQILALGHIPIGMELFNASDETQWNYIKRRIDNCDYYIVIVGERYGSEYNGKSYTQMEYEYALTQGIPAAAFLLHNSARASWPQSKVEADKLSKINEFRSLCEEKIVSYWKNGDDLAAKVTTTLVGLFRDFPRTGWIKSDNAASPRVANEIAQLSEENRKLKEMLEKLSAESNIPANIQAKLELMASQKASIYIEFTREPPADKDILSLFIEINRSLTQGASDWSITRAVQAALFGEETLNYINIKGCSELIGEYIFHKLVSIYTVQNNFFGELKSETRYILTDYAKDFIGYADRWISERAKTEQGTSP